jgi:hypothetical protein
VAWHAAGNCIAARWAVQLSVSEARSRSQTVPLARSLASRNPDLASLCSRTQPTLRPPGALRAGPPAAPIQPAIPRRGLLVAPLRSSNCWQNSSRAAVAGTAELLNPAPGGLPVFQHTIAGDGRTMLLPSAAP